MTDEQLNAVAASQIAGAQMQVIERLLAEVPAEPEGGPAAEVSALNAFIHAAETYFDLAVEASSRLRIAAMLGLKEHVEGSLAGWASEAQAAAVSHLAANEASVGEEGLQGYCLAVRKRDVALDAARHARDYVRAAQLEAAYAVAELVGERP